MFTIKECGDVITLKKGRKQRWNLPTGQRAKSKEIVILRPCKGPWMSIIRWVHLYPAIKIYNFVIFCHSV